MNSLVRIVIRGQKAFFLLGLAAVILYWVSIRPPGTQRGYIEDFGQNTITRQIIGDQIREGGGPQFRTQHYGLPDGISVAYMPWTIEESWVGGYFSNWNPDFPFVWAYLGFSLLVTYLGVGIILYKMKLPVGGAWALAAFVTVFHVPRHLVTWHRMQILYLHWIYLSFFLDAWIWQRFIREKRLSWNLELWRVFCVFGVFGSFGYFWGPAILEWIIVRLCIGAVYLRYRESQFKIKFESQFSRAVLPGVLIVLYLVIELRWFLPLRKEAMLLGHVSNGLGYFAPINLIFSPLWVDSVINWAFHIFPQLQFHRRPITFPETPVTIGWVYWIPVLMGIRALRKKKSGPGLLVVLPFFILLGIVVWYTSIQPKYLQYFLQAVVPFMSFFRVMSRWGIFYPIIAGVLIALSWPELSKWFVERINRRSNRKFGIYLCIFIALSFAEMTWLFRPPRVSSDLSSSMVTMLEKIRDTKGSAILDMPFCLTGGNGVCLSQCPAYPISTAGAGFRGWHKKDVYGIYQSRLVESQCDMYKKRPFDSWFAAWREHRCFSSQDWKEFCEYLSTHSEMSAILVYPEIWWGAGPRDCLEDFRNRLGTEQGLDEFLTPVSPEGQGGSPVHVYWFRPQCR